jgi:hypothetical protein
MKTKEWAHLPSAKYIDWVIASILAHPDKWAALYRTAKDASIYNGPFTSAWAGIKYEAGYKLYSVIQSVIDDATRDAKWKWPGNGAVDAAKNLTYTTIVALMGYSDSGYMIESDVGELRLIAAFGNERAIMLLPACIIYNETKELTNLITHV